MSPASPGITDVKVSVCMITYNHERFVVQAIESVLMQETDFLVELVIGEDCSTDSTRAIVTALQTQYPNRIRLLLREANLGMLHNYVETMQECRGEYIAVLEGDDYWSAPHKLRRQADFLDREPDCALCFHNVYVEREDGSRDAAPYCSEEQKDVLGIEDLLWTNPIPHGSVMFRRQLLDKFPEWYFTLGAGDRPLFIMLAQKAAIYYLDEVMGVYRMHQGGIYTSRSYDRRFEETMRMYDTLSIYLEHRHDAVIVEAKGNYMAELVAEKAKSTASFPEGLAAVQSTLREWQTAYALPKAWRHKALGRVYAYFLFSSRAGQVDRRTARHCFIRMLRHDPSWLGNSGVWSLAADAFLGAKMTGWLRRVSVSGAGRGQLCRKEAK